MTRLEIRLLGDFELYSDAAPRPLPATLKAQSLLAYLVMRRDRPCIRESLAECFWLNRPPDRALHSLSTALWHIRRILPPGDFLLADAQTVQFNPGSDFWLDVAVFCDLLHVASTLASPAEKAAHLQQAVALYRGDFLEHFYDDWCLEERYALEARYLEALEQLLALNEALERPEVALEVARRLLAWDPLREDIHRIVIRLLVTLNRRSEALHQARDCRDILRAELDLAPQQETLALCTTLLGANWDRAAVETRHVPCSTLRSPRPFLLERPPFVGRATEWTRVLARWDAACAGRGGFVLLSGEAGVGKSRLAEELRAHVQQHGGCVALVHCYENERILPYGPLADLLRTFSAAAPDALHRLPRWQAIELVYLLPESDAYVALPDDAQPDPQRQARLFDAVNFFLLEQAQRRPLLLILEDLHWASDSTLAWLHSLGRCLETAPVLLLGSCRSEEVPASHPLYRLHTSLERAGLATRVDLARLEPAALAGWFAEAAPEFTARLYRQTEGNPFFALETLRALHDTGMVRITSTRQLEVVTAEPLPVPESVREVLHLRLARLTSTAREAAGVAAVIGRTFDFETLQRAWGRTEESTLEALDELLRRRLICESDTPTGEDYEFDHHLIRELLYTDLHYRRRRRWHRAVGAALETPPVQPDVAARIAYHFDAAGELRRALPYYEHAAREAQRQFAWQDTETYFARLLALLDVLDPAGDAPELCRQRAQVLALRAGQLDHLGRLEERDADIAGLEKLVAGGDPYVHYLALIRRTSALNYGGRYREALRTAETGLALARDRQDAVQANRFLTQSATAYYFLGQPRRALEALETARHLLDDHDAHLQLRARLYQHLGYVHFHLAQWEQALRCHEQARRDNTALGDHSRAVWNLLDAAYLRLKLGCAAEAHRELRAGLDIACQLRLPAAEGYARLLLGEWALYQGRYTTAEESLCQALPLNEATRGAHNALATREMLGWARYHQGDLSDAHCILDSAVAAARRIEHRRLLVASLIGLGLVMAEEEAYAAAQDALEEALTIAQESECVENMLKGLCALARVTRLQGDVARALTYAREALAQPQPGPTTEMWAALESGLAHLALGEAEAALHHTAHAVALLPRAHAAWLRPEEIHAAHTRALETIPRAPSG